MVRVRVVGGASIGWLDALRLWGASVEVFVCQGGNVKHLVEDLYPDVFIAPLVEAADMPPHRGWDGILFATLDTEEASQHVATLVERWRPSTLILAAHKDVSRHTFYKWIDFSDLGYEFKSQHRCKHQDFGGVTTSSWKFAFIKLHKEDPLEFSIARMTAGLYTRHLQTALDDTLGPATGRKRLDR